MRRPLEPGHFGPEPFGFSTVPPVRDHEHDGSVTEHASGPSCVECAQSVSDPRAARKVGDLPREPRDDLRDGVLPPPPTEVSGDSGQACGEDEHLNLVETATHAIQEVQQHPRVAFHRPTDVAQENQRATALLALAAGEVDKLSAMRGGPSHQASEIESRATPSPPASRPAHPDVPTEVGHHALGLAELAFVELGKVLLSDCFAVAVAQGCDLVDLEGRGNRRLCPIGICPGRRFELRIASASLLAHGAKVRRRPVTWRRTPEHAEGVVEQGEILGTMHEQTSQRVIELAPISDVDVLDGVGDVEGANGLHVDAGRTQQTGEMKEVRQEGAHVPACFARFNISCTRSPRTDWMSSWFFSTIPRV